MGLLQPEQKKGDEYRNNSEWIPLLVRNNTEALVLK